MGLEIVVGEAERNAAIMIRSAAEDPRTHPAELVIGSDRVGFAGDFPEGIRSAKVAEVRPVPADIGQATFAGAAVIDLVWPQVFFEVAGRIQHGSGFEQCDMDAQAGQDLHHSASTGPEPMTTTS